MTVSVKVDSRPITATVNEDNASVTVGGGVGPQGAAATVTVGSVTTGAPGSSASVVNVGTSGAAVFNFAIPAGADGAVGAAGPQGAAGSQGAAATISVGTVTTGAAGSSASVTNAGTSGAAVLNFTIPAGATGAQGPQGATGPAGTTTWAGITDKPSTFSPSAHASQHGSTGSDPITPESIGAAPAGEGDPTAPAAIADAALGLYDYVADAAWLLASDGTVYVTAGYEEPFRTAIGAAPVPSGDFTDPSFIGDASLALYDFAQNRAWLRASDNVVTVQADCASSFRTALGLGSLATLSPTGTADSSRYLRGDGAWSTISTYTLPQATNSTLGGITVSTGLTVSSGALSVSYGTASGTACQGNDSRLSDSRTPTSHTHGNITNAGAIGTTSGQIVVTTTSGVLTTAATISAGSVSGLAAVATSGSASDLTTGTVATARLGTGSATGTTFLAGDGTWKAAGSSSASDLTSGTLADARLSANAQSAISLYLWSNFR